MREEITRRRIISPSTRLKTSKSYKVDTKNVSQEHTLAVTVKHVKKLFAPTTFKFKGQDVARKNSIHFIVNESEKNIIITWSDAKPFEINITKKAE